MSQDKRKIALAISVMAEVEIRAVNPRWNLVPGAFTYNLFSAGSLYGKDTIKKRKDVFSLYKSFQAGKIDRKKNKYLIILFIICLLVPFLFWNFISGFGHEKQIKSKSKNSTTYKNNIDIKSNKKSTNKKEISNVFNRFYNATSPTEKYSLCGRIGDDILIKEKNKNLIFPIRSIFPAFNIVKYMGDFALVYDNNAKFYFFYRYNEEQKTTANSQPDSNSRHSSSFRKK